MKSFQLAKFNHRLVMLLLCAVALAGSGFAKEELHPRIDSVTHNGLGTLTTGDILTVTLRGEPGGVATFDVTNVATRVPMKEMSPGMYQGSYTIDRPREIPFASVTGFLRLKGKELRLVAVKSVSIGSDPAQINPVLQLAPAPGLQMTSSRPQISVAFQNMIQPSTADLVVDGVDYTSQIRVTPNSVDWIPPFDLSPGEHRVVLWVVDVQGQQLRRAWSFYVGNTSNSSPIQTVAESPRTVKAGQTVTATMQGAPSGTAVMSVENGGKIPMTEGPSGTYTGSYVVPNQLQGRYAYLAVKLTTPDGQVETLNDADVVYVARSTGGIPLSLNSPIGGSLVAQVFDVSGTTQPRADVKVHLWGPNTSGAWRDITRPGVRADKAGHFALQIDSGYLNGGTSLTMLVQAQNEQGSHSDVLRIELTRI